MPHVHNRGYIFLRRETRSAIPLNLLQFLITLHQNHTRQAQALAKDPILDRGRVVEKVVAKAATARSGPTPSTSAGKSEKSTGKSTGKEKYRQKREKYRQKDRQNRDRNPNQKNAIRYI